VKLKRQKWHLVVAFSLALGGQATAQAATTPVNWGLPASVVINEVSCSPISGKYVEIFNTDSRHQVSIGGWEVTDAIVGDANAQHRYVFPRGSTIAPGGYITLHAQTPSELPFDIECAKDKIHLALPVSRSWVERDVVTVPNLADGVSWGRLQTRVHQWNPIFASPNAKNRAVSAGVAFDHAAFLYDPLNETTINLNIPTSSEELLKQQTIDTHVDYVPATFQLVDSQGNTFPATPLQIGIRLKGNVGSFRNYTSNTDESINKSGFKLKFDAVIKGQRFFGLKKLTLNNMVQDPAMTNEAVTYRLFREMGITAPRTGFAKLNINGQYRGLYLNLEQYDDVSLAWHYASVDHLYEGKHALPEPTTPDLLGPNIPAKFPVDEGDASDISDLLNLAHDLQNALPTQQNLYGRGERDDIMPNSVDRIEVAKMIAVEKYVSHWDGYSGTPWWAPNNHFLIHPTGQPFQILPWGTDQTWTPISADWLPLLDNGVESFTYASTATLFKFCMTDSVCYPTYVKTLQELPALVASEHFDQYFMDVYNAHTQSRALDVWQGFNEQDRAWAISIKASFIANRATAVSDFTASRLNADIVWKPISRSILYGNAFTTDNLNAISTVPGTLTYSVKLGDRPKLGLVTVTAHLEPTDQAFGSVDFDVTFSVKDSQSISIASISNRRLAKVSSMNKFVVKPKSSSGLAVKTSSESPRICSVVGNVVKLVRKGNCLLTFSQPGTRKFLAATTVQRTFKVT
jgi:hypothetical protein